MKNKELLEKFMKENFDLVSYDIVWHSDWLVELTDKNGDKLCMHTFDPEIVGTAINSVPYLKYRLKDCYLGDCWVIAND